MDRGKVIDEKKLLSKCVMSVLSLCHKNLLACPADWSDDEKVCHLVCYRCEECFSEMEERLFAEVKSW